MNQEQLNRLIIWFAVVILVGLAFDSVGIY